MAPTAAWPELDRRVPLDRRHRPTRIRDSVRGLRRRAGGRRAGERHDIYVDVFRKRDIGMLVAIFTLNILDAFFTLRWLQLGGQEANPLMASIISLGDHVFLIQKVFVVGVWLVILVVHKNFSVARTGLWSLLVLYAGLLIYHFLLQSGGIETPIVQP